MHLYMKGFRSLSLELLIQFHWDSKIKTVKVRVDFQKKVNHIEEADTLINDVRNVITKKTRLL